MQKQPILAVEGLSNKQTGFLLLSGDFQHPVVSLEGKGIL